MIVIAVIIDVIMIVVVLTFVLTFVLFFFAFLLLIISVFLARIGRDLPTAGTKAGSARYLGSAR
jgi:hypothetical protein